VYLTEEQIEALHFTWPDRWTIVRDEEGFCTFFGDVPTEADIAEAEKSEVFVSHTIRAKIARLEAEITPRRLRDALSGSEEAQQWLDDQEQKIKLERARLSGTLPDDDIQAAAEPKNSLEAVIRVLLMGVYADGRQSRAEFDELERQASLILDYVQLPAGMPLPSPHDIVDAQIRDVRSEMNDPDPADAIDRALACIEEPRLVERVSQALYAIMIADREFHLAENQFLATAMKAWGVEKIRGV